VSTSPPTRQTLRPSYQRRYQKSDLLAAYDAQRESWELEAGGLGLTLLHERVGGGGHGHDSVPTTTTHHHNRSFLNVVTLDEICLLFKIAPLLSATPFVQRRAPAFLPELHISLSAHCAEGVNLAAKNAGAAERERIFTQSHRACT